MFLFPCLKGDDKKMDNSSADDEPQPPKFSLIHPEQLFLQKRNFLEKKIINNSLNEFFKFFNVPPRFMHINNMVGETVPIGLLHLIPTLKINISIHMFCLFPYISTVNKNVNECDYMLSRKDEGDTDVINIKIKERIIQDYDELRFIIYLQLSFCRDSFQSILVRRDYLSNIEFFKHILHHKVKLYRKENGETPNEHNGFI